MIKNRNIEIIDFLKQLSANNNKEWFDENRKIYKNLRKYFIQLVQMLIDGISFFDKSVSYEPAKKSIFRINRDLRFTKDKTPYKTNFGAFIVPGGKKSGKAGYYLHIEPKNSFIAGGVYRPQSKVLKKIRWRIYQNIDQFCKIIYEKDFKETFGNIHGEKLKNLPRGFDKSFKKSDLLKFKDYTVIKKITEKDLISDSFIEDCLFIFAKMRAFNTFINKSFEDYSL